MKEIREIIRFWETRRTEPFALATLVRAYGSSYRRPGARMLIDGCGESAGGLSAGCIEEEVIARAQEVIRGGVPRLISFDTRRRFGCSGSIEIFLERISDTLVPEVREHFAARTAFEVATVFENRSTLGSRVVTGFTEPGAFVQRIQPPLRLIVIGTGPDAMAMGAQGALLGWEWILVEAIPRLSDALDDRTAVVIATHNFGRDCAALRFFLSHPLRYVGLIGPRRRRDEILLDVIDSGVERRAQLFAPAGLHLAADSPEEIALSIVAEIQGVFADGTVEHLRDRKAPIHNNAGEWATSAR
jgi:xanthine dehydrogenase accessory factor